MGAGPGGRAGPWAGQGQADGHDTGIDVTVGVATAYAQARRDRRGRFGRNVDVHPPDRWISEGGDPVGRRNEQSI
jgi:hypothetical protein